MSNALLHIKNKTKSICFNAPCGLAGILKSAGISQNAPCGGSGRCGKCKIKAQGDLSAVSDSERAKLTESELKENIRLCCRGSDDAF